MSNREIKFRAWDGNRMIHDGMHIVPAHLIEYGHKYFTPAKVYHDKVEIWFKETQLPNATDESFDHPTVYPNCQFMQFTGLKDKNGVEIYEGDILKWHEPGGQVFTCELNFYKGCFYLFPKEEHGHKFPIGTWDEDCEVVGNIYQTEKCPTCGGDGKETCNNPDHGFIGAIGHEIGRLGCPVCGHDPNCKVPNGGKCEECSGTGYLLPQTIQP